MITIDSKHYSDCTLGRLSCGDFSCFTLELAWLDNKKNISCVPEGIYDSHLYFSPRFDRWVIVLTGVPGRSYIEIHAGNFTRDIEGCILVGNGIKNLDSDNIPDVTSSNVTLNNLIDVINNKIDSNNSLFKISIKR